VAAKPDGKSRSDRLVFTRPAVERIANVVRLVEGGDRDSAGLTLRKGAVAPDTLGVFFHVCTFTGAWAINAPKVVTFKYQASTPNTVVATNLFFPVPQPSGTVDCAVARDGTAWFLVDVPLETATAVFVSSTSSETVLSGITVSAVLNTSNCAITVSLTQATSSVTLATGTYTSTFVRFKVS
jgi:hypothetical protein